MWQRFVRWFSPETRFQRAWHIGVTALGLIIILVLVGDGLLGLVTHINQANAQNAKTTLDAALKDATTHMSVPEGMLQPIRTQEQQAAAATDGSLSGYQHATDTYTKLTAQVKTIVNMPASQARAMTQKDLDQLASGVDTLVKGKYSEAAGYQDRLNQAQTSFQNAKTTREYFVVDGVIQDQVAAVAAFKPTYDQLQHFGSLVATEQKLLARVTDAPPPSQLLCADGVGNSPSNFWTTYYGLMSYPSATPGAQPVEAQWLAQDKTLFHAATSPKDYEALNQQLAGQITQTQATNAALVPSIAAKTLADFKANIDLLQNYENSIPTIKKTFATYKSNPPPLKSFTKDIASFQKLYDQDVATVAKATTSDAYNKAMQQIQKHDASMSFQVIYAKTFLDIVTLGNLVAQGQTHTTLNNQKTGDNRKYPDAYEYADMHTGIGDIINSSAANPGRLFSAYDEQDYQYVDDMAQMFIHNITAMLTNLNDKTPYNQVHQTDMDLMRYYGITQGKVMIVSLREQAARFYVDGKLVKAIYVTTGQPDLPSVPGINCTSGAQTDQLMKSPDPPGSPDYYEPTPVKFGIYYHNYGYEIHDAWWRNEFGPLTNLPHYDPAAFNGGSHGCINVAKGNMPWVFNFVDYGHIPVVVY